MDNPFRTRRKAAGLFCDLSFYHPTQDWQPAFEQFEKDRVLARLQALDSRARRKGLDELDPSRNQLIPVGMEIQDGKVVKNGYGVFHLAWQTERHREWADLVDSEVNDLRKTIREAHGGPLQFVIWAGMGGSAEDKSLYNAIGLLRRSPRVYVLDSTDPAKLQAILEDLTRRSEMPLAMALKRTLVVGMAMGMTSYEPVINLQRLAELYDRYGIDSRPNFIYMTLPGSLLDKFAAKRGYRKVELQPDGANTTAGRHSGPLTRGSLYPLGLCGVDLRSWMQRTALDTDQIAAAWRLAAFLHTEGQAGHDKVTLVLPKEWAGAGLWTKQDFEESLGKSDALGIKIVIGEKLRMTNYRSPKDPTQDRCFLAVHAKGMTNADADKIGLARRAGYPVAVITVAAGGAMATYMQFMHYVVFGIAYLRRMNFVTQPSVELYKSITNKLHNEAAKSGGIQKTKEWVGSTSSGRRADWRGRITLNYDRLPDEVAANAPAPAIYAALLGRRAADRSVEYAELTFFGDTRYSARGKAARKALDRSAEKLFRARLHMPVDVYEGPAMNHSYHEMIIGHGRCFSTVLISARQASVAEISCTSDYHMAQFLATQMALAQRGRSVVSVTLKDLEERTLAALEEFFQQAARCLPS